MSVTDILDRQEIPMFDLINPASDGTLVLFAEEAASARRYAGAAKAASTVLAYKADFAAFTAWCEARGLCAMPASPEAVILHVTAVADAGLSVSSIGRRLAGIAYAHKLAKAPNPTSGEEVKAVLAGIRRTVGAAPRHRKAAATHDLVRRMLDVCPEGTMIGLRDRALLALGFAGAFRRSELVALRVEDLELADDGYRVTIRRSKTDQAGEGHVIPIPRGYRLRPVATVQAWQQAAGIVDGLLFRAVHRGGHVRPWGLRGHDAALIVKSRARHAGLDPALFSGHSLRAGFLTSAAEAGASVFKMQAVSRHKSMDVLSGYVRSADLFREPAGAAFL
jgi:site-specific recombinase XerD